MKVSRFLGARSFPVILGMIGGFLVLYPYTIVISTLMHIHEMSGLHLHLSELLKPSTSMMKPVMWPMGISFVLFGGAVGLLVGWVMERKKALMYIQYEHEKQKIVLDTVKELMVTLSHHLLNSNMIIGGKVRRLAKHISNKEQLKDLQVITDQGNKIDSVVKALREATELSISDYTTSGTVKMIDLESEIEERLNQDNKHGHKNSKILE